MRQPSPLLLLCLLLVACSGSMPSRPIMGDRSISPQAAAEEITRTESLVIEWGGVIVETQNLEASSEIQIIAYPLRDNGKPDLDEPPIGRFIAINQGYLEYADYRKGRTITLSGSVAGIRQGKVGEADYSFPLLEPVEMQLWPLETASESQSRWRFGIGVGSGGRSHGSIGIGIGL